MPVPVHSVPVAKRLGFRGTTGADTRLGGVTPNIPVQLVRFRVTSSCMGLVICQASWQEQTAVLQQREREREEQGAKKKENASILKVQ